PLAFQKHATSKISGPKDLSNIKTMGFRGEALSSIASVARSIEAYTKIKTALNGTYMRLENGRIIEANEIGCPIGTSIAVMDLFHNLPARRKHLTSAERELAFIIDLVTEIAIINPGISFELFTGNKTFFKSARSKTWYDVLLRVYGLKAMKNIVEFQTETDQWTLKGVASSSLFTRSSPDRIFIYVNGRAIHSKTLIAALRDSYKSIIPSGRYPMAVVSLEINPERVDVNVHPTKREIHILMEEEISTALTSAVSLALREKSNARTDAETSRMQPMDAIRAEIIHPSEQRTFHLIGTEAIDSSLVSEKPTRLRVIGQILDLYVLAEYDKGLMMVDQHAAAERIRFEHLLEKYANKTISQELAEPVIVELAPNEIILLESWQETLKEMGFDIAPFGGNACRVQAVPALGRKLENPEILHDVLRDLFALRKVSPDSTKKDEMLKILACRGSIKSGHKMTLAEMSSLLEELFACPNHLTCPHGRPIAVLFRMEQLEKFFDRR
ncbi:MAG: DNA mismatch repair endonuclease MutL, partial [Methanotrichaceae archaeon]|nr:DNA mismatch repair endonuclease MutL [Methanotrichaceae archaeon]